MDNTGNKAQLNKILEEMEVPKPDENAKKRAVNLAMAEFKNIQQEKEKNFQGLSFLSRLMGNSKENHRRRPMNNRLVYSGMATAMVVVLAVGASMTEFQSGMIRSAKNVDEIRPVSSAVVSTLISPDMEKRIKEKNELRVEEAIRSSGNALPTPINTAKKSLGVSKTDNNRDDQSTVTSARQVAKLNDGRARELQQHTGARYNNQAKELAGNKGWIDGVEKSQSKTRAKTGAKLRNEEGRMYNQTYEMAEVEAEIDSDFAGVYERKASSDKKEMAKPSSVADRLAPNMQFSIENNRLSKNMPAQAPVKRGIVAGEAVAPAVVYGGGTINSKAKRAVPNTIDLNGALGNVASVYPDVEMFIVDDIAPIDEYKDVGRDRFEDFEISPIKLVSEEPVSTFSIDVDTASYSFMRRQIKSGLLPQKDSIRIEELINYFDYDYPLPESKETPFSTSVNIVPSPWKDGNKLIHIGIKGYDIDTDIAQPDSNIVFLLDVSGSMNSPDKLPLMVNSLKLLLDSLKPTDTVGIVVYAGAAGTVLEPTAISDKGKILAALDNLRAGGSTAGAEGIRQAYQLAENNFKDGAVNRVILATDGDFNVGITNREELKDFIERKRETGVFLSVFGFGQGNYNDHLMQQLAQNGNGVAAYIDTLSEARKILVDEATSTLFPIAKDVKIQVDFNPETVAEYRLIGYETRALAREDFNNDKVDAGDIGAGHTVTAIYEITPVGGNRTVDDSRYTKTAVMESTMDSDFGNEYAFLKIRYKLPNEDTSTLITTPITKTSDLGETKNELASWQITETGWATAVAGFGQLLKGDKHAGSITYDDVIKIANANKGKDEFGYRAEFVQLVRLAKSAAALQDTQP